MLAPQMSLVLLAVLIAAVVFDLRSHRIPNVLTLPALASAIAWHGVTNGWSGLGASLLGATIGLLAFLPFYALRAMGAGDVKLLAATGAFLGPKGAILTAIAALIAGGVAAVAYLGYRSAQSAYKAALRDGLSEIGAGAYVGIKIARRERFPFALPIAIGGCISLFTPPDLLPFAAWTGL